MKLNYDILDRLRNINWFENCGESISIAIKTPTINVGSWAEAKKIYNNPYCEDIALESHNQLTQFLFEYFNIQYQEWNDLVHKAKEFMNLEVIPKVESYAFTYNLGQSFIDYVKWDVLHIIMADVYAWTDHDQRFYGELLEVYEAGRYPCGWTGEFSSGSLMVY